MTANANQPNRGNQDASQGRSQTGRSGEPAGESAAGAWAAQHGQKGPAQEEATRYLDAIEQNVKNLRSAMSGTGRSSESEESEDRERRSAGGEEPGSSRGL